MVYVSAAMKRQIPVLFSPTKNLGTIRYLTREAILGQAAGRFSEVAGQAGAPSKPQGGYRS